MPDEVIMRGIGAAPGQAMGPVMVYHRPQPSRPAITISSDEASIAAEQARVDGALSAAVVELQALAEEISRTVGKHEAAIFEAQSLMCADPTLGDRARDLVAQDLLPADAAILASAEEQAAVLAQLDDAYFRERAMDLRDIGARAARLARGEAQSSDLSRLPAPVIVLADDLTPSETARLDRDNVLGLGLLGGGPTSHVAVMARSLGVPLVCGLAPFPASGAAPALLDGGNGLLIINPAPERISQFTAWDTARKQALARQSELRDLPAQTPDGRIVRLVANAGSVAEANLAAQYGAEGIGLLRTEFLFLDHEPDEEAQLNTYSQVNAALPGREIIVRTMDLGGDKPPPYLDFGSEANPFLGWRGLRVALDLPGMLRTQVRAILRSAPGGIAYVMFPMVSTLEEFREAKDLVDGVRHDLAADGLPAAEDVKVGIMVEVPSAALMARSLAAEADFFSIGTNDLTQYTMAADRGSSRVAYLYSPVQPGVLQLIKMTVDAAHSQQRWVGMCGEAAGNPAWTALWLGIGLDELSMAPSAVPGAKEIIRRTTLAEAQALAAEALRQDTLAGVEAVLSAAVGREDTATARSLDRAEK